MKKMTFDEIWSMKYKVWDSYSSILGTCPHINDPHFDWFNMEAFRFKSLEEAIDCIKDSELEEIDDVYSERGLELFSIYTYLLCFMYFIYYALSLKIKPNGYKKEMAICIEKIRNHLKMIPKGESIFWPSAHGFLSHVYSPFNIYDWKNKNNPLQFEADSWINERLHDFQNFINGARYNDEFTPFHLWALCHFDCYDCENCWSQGSLSRGEREAFFALAQYCIYAKTPRKLYQNINNFIINDFINAPFDSREYVVYSTETKPIKMDKSKLWTTIENTSSIIKILDLDKFFRFPEDNKKEEKFYRTDFNKKKMGSLIFYMNYPAIIVAIRQLINCTSGLCYSSDKKHIVIPTNEMSTPKGIEDYFKNIFNLPKSILDKYPALYRILYLAIQYIDYNKFKKIFQYEINAPESFAKEDKIWRTSEHEKLSILEFIDDEKDIDKLSSLMKVALADFKRKDVPEIYYDTSELKRSAYSKTETIICLLYNISTYLRKDSNKAIMQQSNFCAEQRDRLFDYPKISSSSLTEDNSEGSSTNKKTNKNSKKKNYLDFSPQERDIIDEQIKLMQNNIDNGCSISLTQRWPDFGTDKYLKRNIDFKLFIETDSPCNLDLREYYKTKRLALTKHKYIFPERHMMTHYSKFSSTEELLNEEHYVDLLEFLFNMTNYFDKDNQILYLVKELKRKKICSNPFFYSFGEVHPMFEKYTKNEFTRLIEKVKKEAKSLTKEQKNQIETFLNKKDSASNMAINVQQFSFLLEIRNSISSKASCIAEVDNWINSYFPYFTIVRKENQKCIIKNLKIIDEAMINSKSKFIESVDSCIDSNDDEKISKLTYFLICYSSNEELKKKLRKYQFINEDICDKDKLIEKRNTLINEINQYMELSEQQKNAIQSVFCTKKTVLESIINNLSELYKKECEKISQKEFELDQNLWGNNDLYKISILIHNTQNIEKIHRIIQNIQIFKTQFKNLLHEAINDVFNYSYAEEYSDMLSNNNWEGLSKLLFLDRIEMVLRYIDIDNLDKIIINETMSFATYYQVKEIFAQIEKLQSLNNSIYTSKTDISFPSLKKILENQNIDLFHKKIEEISEVFLRNRDLIYDIPPNDHISDSMIQNTNSMKNESELIERRREHFNQIKTFLSKLIEHKNWRRTKNCLNNIEYDEIYDCSFKYKCDFDFLEYCTQLSSYFPKESLEILGEYISRIQKTAMQKINTLRIEEKTVRHWSIFSDINANDNPILKTTKKLFIKTIQFMGESEDLLNDFNTNQVKKYNNKTQTLIDEDGALGLARKDIGKRMKDCSYNELFKQELREYLNTLFGISHICDDKKQEVNFFDLYGDQIMSYLIKVTLRLASLPSQKIEDQVN